MNYYFFMYIDSFINGISFLITLIIFIELPIYLNARKELSYKATLMVTKIVKVVMYLFFTIAIFLISFFKIKYLGTALGIGMISTMLLVYTIIDLFYFQNLKDDYINAIQKQLCSKDNVKKLFKIIINNGAKYELIKDDARQSYGIVETEKYGKCITNNKQKILYKPIKLIDDAYLAFYAKCLEFDKDNIPLFDDKESFKLYIRYYHFIKPSRFFYWIKQRRKIIAKTLIIIIVVAVIIFVILVLLGKYNVWGIGDWLSIEIN